MKLRVTFALSIGLLFVGCVGVALAQTKAQAGNLPSLEGLWTMAQAAGLLGTGFALYFMREARKDLADERKAKEALYERYIADIGKTRDLTQRLEQTVSSLVDAMAAQLAVRLRDRQEG